MVRHRFTLTSKRHRPSSSPVNRNLLFRFIRNRRAAEGGGGGGGAVAPGGKRNTLYENFDFFLR